MGNSPAWEPCQRSSRATSAMSVPLIQLIGGAICCNEIVGNRESGGGSIKTLATAPSDIVYALKRAA
jgi:hypothetical protein